MRLVENSVIPKYFGSYYQVYISNGINNGKSFKYQQYLLAHHFCKF